MRGATGEARTAYLVAARTCGSECARRSAERESLLHFLPLASCCCQHLGSRSASCLGSCCS